MKQIILDTNGYAAFKHGNPEIIAIIQQVDIIGFTPVILGELLAGFAIGTKTKKNQQELNKFLSSSRVYVYPVDENTAIQYAHIYASLRKKGAPIPTNDMWIGASALQHGCALCSFNKHFTVIDNLLIVQQVEDLLL
ncbi:MAG: type II toxin-antitoxin system VapC family toxin [Gammaproteobacteria bacterium]